MAPSLLVGAVLAWGIPFSASPGDAAAGAYLGVIEKLQGDRVWVRAAFARARDGDWTPTLVADQVHGREELDAAPGALPARITWRACRDGRSLGTIVSSRRHFASLSELATHALRSPPSFIAAARDDERFRVITTDVAAARPFVISTVHDAC